jgi:tRNA G37 N-methylase TrmD
MSGDSDTLKLGSGEEVGIGSVVTCGGEYRAPTIVVSESIYRSFRGGSIGAPRPLKSFTNKLFKVRTFLPVEFISND